MPIVYIQIQLVLWAHLWNDTISVFCRGSQEKDPLLILVGQLKQRLAGLGRHEIPVGKIAG